VYGVLPRVRFLQCSENWVICINVCDILSVVGRGTMLQTGRARVRFPMRSLGFSIHLILPGTL
jgi:hypothetical protein